MVTGHVGGKGVSKCVDEAQYTVDATANTFFSANYGITISNDTRFSFYERDFSSTNPAALSYANLQTLLSGRNLALPYAAGGGVTYLQRGWGVQNVLSAKGEFMTGSIRHKAMVGLDTIYQRDHRDQGTWTGRMNNQTVVNPAFYNSPNATVAYSSTRDANATDIGVFMSDRVYLNDRARRDLGWTPACDFASVLAATAQSQDRELRALRQRVDALERRLSAREARRRPVRDFLP